MGPADAAARTGRVPRCAARLPTARGRHPQPAAAHTALGTPQHSACTRADGSAVCLGWPPGLAGRRALPSYAPSPAARHRLKVRRPRAAAGYSTIHPTTHTALSTLLAPAAASLWRDPRSRPRRTRHRHRAAMAHSRPARDTETHQTHDQAVCSGVLVVDGSKSGARARGCRDRATVATARERGAKPRPPAPRAEGGAQRCRGNPAALCVAPGRAAGGPPRAADQRR